MHAVWQRGNIRFAAGSLIKCAVFLTYCQAHEILPLDVDEDPKFLSLNNIQDFPISNALILSIASSQFIATWYLSYNLGWGCSPRTAACMPNWHSTYRGSYMDHLTQASRWHLWSNGAFTLSYPKKPQFFNHNYILSSIICTKQLIS